MNKNKTTTALTEAIQAINKDIRHYATHIINMPKSEAEKWKPKLHVANKHKRLLISLLQKEREDMQDMAHYGHQQSEQWAIDAENIFNNNFTQYKTTDNE